MNIYVGNLSFSTTDDELSEMFGVHGEVVSANVIKDRYTGRSRGFGFVEMSDQAAAQTAIEEINEKEIGGRALKVNEARPKGDQGDQ